MDSIKDDCDDRDEDEAKTSWYDEVYEQPRSKVSPHCHAALMSPPDEDEMLQLCSSCKYLVAPG